MKNLLRLIILIFLLILINLSAVFAATPLRVAILPIFNSSNTFDDNTEQCIAKALQNRFHMPLDQVIPLYEVIPSQDIQAVMPPELKNRYKPGKISKPILKEIGEKLRTDVVIAVEITDFSLFTIHKWDGDTFVQNELTIHIYGFDMLKDKFLDMSDSQQYHGDISVMSAPEYLAEQVMERLMKKIPYTWNRSKDNSVNERLVSNRRFNV